MSWNNNWRPKGKSVNKYLITKNNLIRLIAFTAVFSLAFINLYKPFNSEKWYPVSSVGYFAFSFILVLTGIIVIAISRYVMYRFVRKHSLYNTEYALWIVLEIVALSGFYTLYTIAVRDDLNFWSWEDIITVFKDASINTFLVIFLPYTVSWLFFSYTDKKGRLKQLENSVLHPEPTIIQFHDEKGELRFSVSSENIIYLEAADNYVEINYLKQGKITQHLLRNSLKKLSSELDKTAIRRCHRSYMVNFEHVIALRRNNDEIDLEIDVPDIKKIPVSKTHGDETTEAFMAFSGRQIKQ
ncbi:MAG TPA: LytTR family transcriptional regulator DNA-binding domain-containing protein [Candidatus Enterocola sp.]|nr:LytTR family transcriptional regulator DNA-binding domain-containing protein [Candidatus Enterocola sp.]